MSLSAHLVFGHEDLGVALALRGSNHRSLPSFSFSFSRAGENEERFRLREQPGSAFSLGFAALLLELRIFSGQIFQRSGLGWIRIISAPAF